MKRRDLYKKLRKTRDTILWEKFYFNRGKSIWSDLFEMLTLTTIVGLFVDKLNTAFGANIPVDKAMMAVPFIMILYWITGRLDFKKLHLIQVENMIQLTANPALYDKIKGILKGVRKVHKTIRYNENRKARD